MLFLNVFLEVMFFYDLINRLNIKTKQANITF